MIESMIVLVILFIILLICTKIVLNYPFDGIIPRNNAETKLIFGYMIWIIGITIWLLKVLEEI